MPSMNFEQENVLRNTDNPDVARGMAHGAQPSGNVCICGRLCSSI